MRLGLRAQIALTLLGLTGLTAFLVAFPVINLMERALLEQELRAAYRLVPLVRASLDGDGETEPDEGFAGVPPAVAAGLVWLLETGVAERLEWVSPEGEPTLALPEGGDWAGRRETAPSSLAAEGEARVVEEPDGARFIRLTVPLGEGGAQGAVVLWLWMGEGDRLETARFLTLLYGLLVAGLALVMGFARLSRLVVAPIRRIRVATERVAEGDRASRLDIVNPKEIGDLAASFNHMLDRLEDGRRALEGQVVALQSAKRELEHAQRAVLRGEKLASVGRLAAGVAHEVGNPLAAVLGLVELLRDDPDVPATERDDMLARLERELLRIHETIRNLLDYSRSGDEEITVLDTTEVVEQSFRLVEAQPRFRRIALELDREEELPLVRADADRLLQVMVNLLLNAADAIAGEGRVTVRLVGQEDGVVLSVSDSGPGIAPEVMSHLFEPFFTTKPPGEGTGLGLAICESIVEGFGGELTVDGGGGERGATFTVWLPAEPASEPVSEK